VLRKLVLQTATAGESRFQAIQSALKEITVPSRRGFHEFTPIVVFLSLFPPAIYPVPASPEVSPALAITMTVFAAQLMAARR